MKRQASFLSCVLPFVCLSVFLPQLCSLCTCSFLLWRSVDCLSSLSPHLPVSLLCWCETHRVARSPGTASPHCDLEQWGVEFPCLTHHKGAWSSHHSQFLDPMKSLPHVIVLSLVFRDPCICDSFRCRCWWTVSNTTGSVDGYGKAVSAQGQAL